jgi:solute carrier family 6 amino acid transporter-like protein 5/7/9/14
MPTLFSTLFFLMFYILGMGSNLAMISANVTAIRDEFKSLPTWLVSLGYIIVASACGYFFAQPVSFFI